MFRKMMRVGIVVSMVFAFNSAAADPTGDACACLTALQLPDVRIELGEHIVPAEDGSTTVERVTIREPFCRVKGVIEGEIRFELWLPDPAAWTGRFYCAGNGGLAGFIRYPPLGRGVARGMASMSTDTGHVDTQIAWARNRPRAVENYAYRGMHLATVAAKVVTEAYYGQSIDHSYFSGCSGGGMQGINEAALYPGDYDGIITGAHGMSYAAVQARMLMLSRNKYEQRPEAWLTNDDWKAINAAAVKACGDKNGVIRHPERCRFDPATTPGLSPAKVETARQLLTTVTNAAGDIIYDGINPGAGRTAPSRAITEPRELFGMWLHKNPQWDLDSLDLAKDIPGLEYVTPGINLAGADLTLFERRGGKMIAYIGTLDPWVPVSGTVRYHAGVAEKIGAARANNFDRLFVLPGVAHCSGGILPDQIGAISDPPIINAEHDVLSAIITWVEQGKTPDYIIASRKLPDGTIETQRVNAYPLSTAGKR